MLSTTEIVDLLAFSIKETQEYSEGVRTFPEQLCTFDSGPFFGFSFFFIYYQSKQCNERNLKKRQMKSMFEEIRKCLPKYQPKLIK